MRSLPLIFTKKQTTNIFQKRFGICMILLQMKKNVQKEHFFEKKFADINKMHTFATANEKHENPCVPGSIPGGTTFTKRKIMKTAEIQLFQRFFLCTVRKNMQGIMGLM